MSSFFDKWALMESGGMWDGRLVLQTNDPACGCGKGAEGVMCVGATFRAKMRIFFYLRTTIRTKHS